MAFVALRFDAPAATAEAWSDAMLAAGAASVDAADANAGTGDETPRYGEPGHEGALWSVCRLTALFAADADVEASVRRAAASLGVETPAFTLENLAEQDWVRRTQAQFGPLRIADGLWVIPSWCEPVDPQAINLELDPGLAFGTGSHPTTRLCLRWLAANLAPGQSVLDYGCGSGILAIAALKLGAASAVGVDNDPQALTASADNAERNEVAERLALFLPEDHDVEPADVFVANILAGPLAELAPTFAAAARPGAPFAISGILKGQEDELLERYAEWFEELRADTREDWVRISGRRRQA